MRRALRHLTAVAAALSALAAAAAAQPAAPAPPDTARAVLTLEEAVRIGLDNNHQISLSRDDAEAAVNDRKAGVGAFLPEASATASHSGTLDGGETSTSLGASAGLTLFNGFRNVNAYRRLRFREEGAELAHRLEVESTLEAIVGGYYGIAQQKLRLEAIRELLAVSAERARLAQARMEVGAGSRLEQLQALSDLNADSASFLAQQVSLREAKLDLNRLLARDPALDFDVADTIPLEADLPVDAWRSGLGENSTALKQARAQRSVASLGLKEARGGWLPTANASLGYATTPDALAGEAGAREDGASYRLSLSVPIFDRFRTRRDVANARIALRQGETRLRQQEQEVAAGFERALERHRMGLRRVALEERNLEVSSLQAEAARERYRLGASSPLEFRDAQTRLLDSRSRLAAARLETKAAELALKRLSGALVQDVPGARAAAAKDADKDAAGPR